MDRKTKYINVNGFTLAEILITLGIIGVVAALTLPAVIANSKKKEIATRVGKFYSVMNQAIIRSVIDNGSPENWSKSPGDLKKDDGTSDYEGQSQASYLFWETYFAPYIKTLSVNKGVYDKNNSSSYYETEVIFIDGSQVKLHNGGCIDLQFDANGKKLPNKYGIDMFTFLFCQGNASVAYFGNKNKFFGAYFEGISREEALKRCKSSAYVCSALLLQDGWEFKSDYPYSIH